MGRRTLDEIPEPVILPSEETVQKRIKLKLIDFDAEIAKLNLQSLESSRKMIRDIDEMNERGFHTLAALEDQDEQLDKIEENLSHVNEDLNVVSTNVRKMDEYCGCNIFRLMRRPFKRFQKRERDIIKEEVLEKLSTPTSSGKDDFPVTFRNNSNKKQSGNFINRLTNDTIEDEIEKNMQHVDQGIESIKNLAVDMHVQLKIQEPKLSRIEELAERNDFVVEGVNYKVKKMIH